MSIRVIYDHGRALTRQDTEKQRLLQAVQAAALVQAALVYCRIGLTIHLRVTAAAGRRVPVTGFRVTVDRCAKPAIVLLLRGRLAGSWQARVSRRRPWVRLRRTFRLLTAVAVPQLCAGVTAFGVRSAGMPAPLPGYLALSVRKPTFSADFRSFGACRKNPAAVHRR